MSTRRALPPAGLAVLPLFLFPALVHAGPWSLAPGEAFVDFRGGYFSADTYHDPNGDRQALFHGGKQQERTIASYLELGWKKRVSVQIGVPFHSVARVPDPSRAQLPDAAGLSDLLFGLRGNLANGSFAAALQLEAKLPLGYESGFISTPPDVAECTVNGELDTNCMRQVAQQRVGEGSTDLSVALHVGQAFDGLRGFVQGSGGYKLRSEDLPAQAIASADAGFWIGRTLLAAGQYRGEFAIEDATLPTDEVERHLVGPMLLLRVDAALDVYVGSLHTASAKNWFHTDEVFVGLSVRNSKLGRLQGFLGGPNQP